MRLRSYILIFLIAVVCTGAPAQHSISPSDSCKVRLNGEYLKSWPRDAWQLLKSPVRWNGKQWAVAAAVGGVAVLAYTQDDHITEAFQRNRIHGLDKAATYFLDPLGKGVTLLSIAGGMSVYGALADKPHTLAVGLTGVKALVLSGLFTYTLKHLAQRHRPGADIPSNPRLWDGPFGGFHHNSFPSGHASAVFALASVLASAYHDRLWVPITAYSLAGLVAVSRVYENKHWASDVVIGSAIGFFVGKFVYKSTLKCPRLALIPGTPAAGFNGLTVVYQLR